MEHSQDLADSRPATTAAKRPGLDEDSDELAVASSHGAYSLDRLKQDAENAVHHLLDSSDQPAVLLERAWHVLGTPFVFEHLDLFREVAAKSGCLVIPIAYPEAGGLVHLLFVARVKDLSYADLLACLKRQGPLRVGSP